MTENPWITTVTMSGETVSSNMKRITSKEAAAIIGITPNNLRQYVFRKMIAPVERQGRRVLFDEADIRVFAEARHARLNK